MNRTVVPCVTLLMVLIGVAVAASKPTVNEVASKLSCYCGTCPHLVVTECGCGTADQIKADIQKMIDSGMTQNQIIKSYVDRYGATVLSAPPKKGFSLTAWILPFLGFATGFGTLVFFLKKQKTVATQEVLVKEGTEQYRNELERELEQLK